MYEYNERRVMTELYGHDEKAGQDAARIRQAMSEKGEARQVVIATEGVIPSEVTPFIMISLQNVSHAHSADRPCSFSLIIPIVSFFRYSLCSVHPKSGFVVLARVVLYSSSTGDTSRLSTQLCISADKRGRFDAVSIVFLLYQACLSRAPLWRILGG